MTVCCFAPKRALLEGLAEKQRKKKEDKRRSKRALLEVKREKKKQKEKTHAQKREACVSLFFLVSLNFPVSTVKINLFGRSCKLNEG